MNQTSDSRIRLIVLGGYLGSGKTTWLRHQLHENRFANAHVVVNEAAQTPVDDALLQKAPRLSVLAGGCACCVGKPEMRRLLRQLCDERSGVLSTQKRLDFIVLETSGLADPSAIVESIQSDPVLVNHIVVSEVIVTVDALYALQNLRTEPLGRRQIEAADAFVVTKLDSVPPKDVAILVATLKSLNPGANISGSILGSDAMLPSSECVPPEVLPSLVGEAPKPPIFPTPLMIKDDIDWAAFSVWLSAILHARGDDIVRVKGVVRTPAGRLLLQTVRKVVQSPEILPEESESRDDNTIVVIGRGYDADDLKRSLYRFASAKVS